MTISKEKVNGLLVHLVKGTAPISLKQINGLAPFISMQKEGMAVRDKANIKHLPAIRSYQIVPKSIKIKITRTMIHL